MFTRLKQKYQQFESTFDQISYWRGVLIAVALFFETVSVTALLVITLRAIIPGAETGVFIMAGMMAFCLGVGRLLRRWADHFKRSVPPGFAAIVRSNSGGVRMVHNTVRGISTETRNPVDAQYSFGEKVLFYDLRQQVLTLYHYCRSSDGANVSVTVTVVWLISDLSNFVHETKDAAKILETFINRNLTHHICKTPSRQLTNDTSNLEVSAGMDAPSLQDNGIHIIRIQVVSIQVLMNQSASQQPATSVASSSPSTGNPMSRPILSLPPGSRAS